MTELRKTLFTSSNKQIYLYSKDAQVGGKLYKTKLIMLGLLPEGPMFKSFVVSDFLSQIIICEVKSLKMIMDIQMHTHTPPHTHTPTHPHSHPPPTHTHTLWGWSIKN